MKYSEYLKKASALLKKNDAKLIAHYYVDEHIQKLAEDTGGFVSDSLEMARYGSKQKESTLIVAGVKFMGETAKILNPDKSIRMLDIDATCSLDTGCDFREFQNFCRQNPEREVVVYANTSAEVKSISDWVVTSSMAVSLVEHLTSMGKKLIWAPDLQSLIWVLGIKDIKYPCFFAISFKRTLKKINLSAIPNISV